MKRTPMPRSTKPLPRSGMPRRRKPLRRTSAKKAASDRLMDAVRDVVKDRADGMCEAHIEGVCVGHGRHAHHIKLRSQGGEHTAENLKWLCPECHSWAHSNPKEAAARGLMTLRGAA